MLYGMALPKKVVDLPSSFHDGKPIMAGSPARWCLISAQLLQCTRWILTDMSNSCKKYYDYVMCLLVLINPRYISYYMIYHVYTIPIGIFFHQQTSLFLGHLLSSAGRWWVVLRRWSSNTKIGTPTTRIWRSVAMRWSHEGIDYSYGHLSIISTYNPIYRMYNPIYNHL